MTEREKMLAGQLYDCGDKELLEQWHKAKDLVRDYNNLDSEDEEGKNRILKELLGGWGKTYGLPPHSTQTMATIFTLGTIAR